MGDTHDLRQFYVGPTGEHEGRCVRCAEGLKPWNGPRGDRETPDGYCACCHGRRSECTHYPGIQKFKQWEDYKEPKPEKPATPKSDKRLCVHCGRAGGLEPMSTTQWGPAHTRCVEERATARPPS